MIRKEEIVEIGSILKPHGIKGEVTASLLYDIDLTELSCIVIPIDRIYVPFFIKSVRPKSTENVIIHIEDINNETEAKEMTGLPYFALRNDVDIDSELSEEGGYISDFIGYELTDSAGMPIGLIVGYDDSTENVLFHVEKTDGKIIFVPVADELIESINPASHSIVMSIPEGLLDL